MLDGKPVPAILEAILTKKLMHKLMLAGALII